MVFRYLIVDDSPFVSELLRGAVDSLGGQCVGIAVNPEEALRTVTATLPDLIFVDLVLPQNNGVWLIRKLLELWPEAKIVAFSSISDERIIKEAIEKGAVGFLKKPFSVEEVRRVLGEFAQKEVVNG
ncbi:MAG: response regulator [Bdellovibrionaceae bacterium]|nr:response regulator [Pseudobdellovibrionaceae bacterium]